MKTKVQLVFLGKKRVIGGQRKLQKNLKRNDQ